ncbi:MAG: NADH-dependent [FeFe] hydrogenase, group A6 [Bacillota bacterium]|nr:NADH-dependent [FeFe] hydrogenase, group A6 [Bacillota bacterium]
MGMIEITINNKKITVPEGITILNAAKMAGIEIPTLCYHPDQFIKANCRVCIVEVKGSKQLPTACSTPVTANMVISTNSTSVLEARKVILELLLANHDADCLICHRNMNCELQKIATQAGVRVNRFENVLEKCEIDTSSPSIVRNPNKCVKCGRCVDICRDIQGLNIVEKIGRSGEIRVLPAFGRYLSDAGCVACGQCATVCPVAAIYEKEEIDRVWEAINNPDLHVIVQTAPAVRVSIGEEFGMEPGSISTGKMVTSLRRLGFDKIFDTDFTADLTIIEEGNELLERIQNGGVLPMITSCSPGWINFIEQYYPDLLPHLSSCKSPQQMFGALAKSYYAKSLDIDPSKIFVTSIMPCTAKKYEAARPEMRIDGRYPDVDAVLTTRELGRMLRQAGIDFAQLPEEPYDDPFGLTTGAGVIFGSTGGVMEAALRTVYEKVTGKTLQSLDFHGVRGLAGIKEAEVDLNGLVAKVAVTHTLSNAAIVLDKIRDGTSQYHFIEVMCCPGGCIGGGGQPYHTTNDLRLKRIAAIYQADRQMPLRKSHQNPAVLKLYENYLEKPLSEKSHHLLHTTYQNRSRR